jgi:hypothetical protein
MNMTIEELLETPYWIIDILPKQVQKDSPGQYFAVERYYLSAPQIAAIKQKHINVILKTNCYRDVSLDDDETVDPPPEAIAEAMMTRYVNVRVDGALIVSEPDDTHLTLFHPDAELLELVRTIAAGEGLFVWQP